MQGDPEVSRPHDVDVPPVAESWPSELLLPRHCGRSSLSRCPVAISLQISSTSHLSYLSSRYRLRIRGDSFLVFCDVKRRWNIHRPWSAASSHEPCYSCFIFSLVMSSEDAQYRCSYCRILFWRSKVSITQPFDMWPSFDRVPDVSCRRLSANIVNLAQIGVLNSHNTQTQGPPSSLRAPKQASAWIVVSSLGLVARPARTYLQELHLQSSWNSFGTSAY